jgi:hypothetical protein
MVLSPDQVAYIKGQLSRDGSDKAIKALAFEYHVTPMAIQHIKYGKTWKHVEPAMPEPTGESEEIQEDEPFDPEEFQRRCIQLYGEDKSIRQIMEITGTYYKKVREALISGGVTLRPVPGSRKCPRI